MPNNLLKKKFILSLLPIVLLCSFPTSLAYSNDELTLGWETWAPFIQTNNDGSLSGLDYELVMAILNNGNLPTTHLGYEVPWIRLLKWIEAGEVDLITGASKTKERAEYAYFSAPYRSESVSLFIRKGDANNYRYTSLKELLSGPFRLGIYKGSTHEEEYKKAFTEVQFNEKFIVVNDDLQYLPLVRSGRIDGFLLDSVAGIAFLKRTNALGITIERHPMAPTETGDIYVMFSKKSTSIEIVEAFNRSLNLLKENGSYDVIMKKYLEN